MAGRLLAEQGHDVVLHARNPARADQARTALPSAAGVLTGDLSTVAAMRNVAEQANALGQFDAVVHNVGIGHRNQPGRVETADGLCRLWAVNVLAPYVLTALVQRPDRLVYLTSGLHLGGDPTLRDVQWSQRAWDNFQAYSDSKLHDMWLAFGLARLWPDVRSNAVSPGWVATRMGGAAATDDLSQGPVTQAWLAVSDDRPALETGRYLYHQRPADEHPSARDTGLQDRLLAYCAEVSGVELKS
jgi:NAD(P)-dependent dehydrogenase (short-subunit alcohol dehydrogenase family)